jgi:hypothetical protein
MVTSTTSVAQNINFFREDMSPSVRNLNVQLDGAFTDNDFWLWQPNFIESPTAIGASSASTFYLDQRPDKAQKVESCSAWRATNGEAV